MTDNSNPFHALVRILPFVGPSRPLVTVIELTGAIGVMAPGRKTLSLARVEKTIEEAFKPANLSAVCLAVNSPGGSPVQSRLIHDCVRRCAKERDVPVLTFIEDVGASGGYILALAGDEIYADASSIVGSIGAISAGFGFQELINRYGVERRVYASGENKSQLDPFKAEDPEDVARLEAILKEIHDQFIALVRARRGDKVEKLDAAHAADLFSGAFWSGEGARIRGLVDGVAQLGDFLRARYGKDVKIKRLTPEGRSLFRRLLGGDAEAPKYMGAVDADAILNTMEARALWARYGL